MQAKWLKTKEALIKIDEIVAIKLDTSSLSSRTYIDAVIRDGSHITIETCLTEEEAREKLNSITNIIIGEERKDKERQDKMAKMMDDMWKGEKK